MKNKILTVLLALLSGSAGAQELVGTPLNVPFPTLLEWVNPSTPDKMPLSDWIKRELVRHAKPEHERFARSVKIRLLGVRSGAPCNSMKNFAQSGVTADGSPEISFCVRTVQYLEQMSRTLSLHAINSMYNDTHAKRRTQILDQYLVYLKGVMNADRDVADTPARFRQFCSVEFYTLVNALGFFGNGCPEAAVSKHSEDFAYSFWHGDFLPDTVFKDKTPEQRTALIRNYAESTHIPEWWGIWRSAALHEFGHLVSCHQGSFSGLRCSNKGSAAALHGEANEIEADGYVLQRVPVAATNDTGKIIATVTQLLYHNLSRAVWTEGLDMRIDRLAAHEKKYKAVYRSVFSSKEFSAQMRKENEAMYQALQAALR